MTRPTVKLAPEAAADLARVRRIRRRIERRNAAAQADYAVRAELFARLLDSGVKQAEIARQAGITPMAVNFAVGEYRARVLAPSESAAV